MIGPLFLDLGPHAVFIWASYGAVAFALGALVLRLVAEGRRHRRDLAALEERGLRRRSAAGDDRQGTVS
jgi:heme exporter protein D